MSSIPVRVELSADSRGLVKVLVAATYHQLDQANHKERCGGVKNFDLADNPVGKCVNGDGLTILVTRFFQPDV